MKYLGYINEFDKYLIVQEPFEPNSYVNVPLHIAFDMAEQLFIMIEK
jgi:hypothetical protein